MTSRATGSTDHEAFEDAGLPGFQFIQDEVEYAISGAGRADAPLEHGRVRPQREDLTQASIVVAAFLYNAATRDEMLPRKPTPTMKPR